MPGKHVFFHRILKATRPISNLTIWSTVFPGKMAFSNVKKVKYCKIGNFREDFISRKALKDILVM